MSVIAKIARNLSDEIGVVDLLGGRAGSATVPNAGRLGRARTSELGHADLEGSEASGLLKPLHELDVHVFTRFSSSASTAAWMTSTPGPSI